LEATGKLTKKENDEKDKEKKEEGKLMEDGDDDK
jgi:hypothetical protein